MLGANPLASNGSLLTAPDMRGRLRALRARGGKLVVVDPRRSRTAEEADEHHPIRPGTDALLLFALVHVLFAEDRVPAARRSPTAWPRSRRSRSPSRPRPSRRRPGSAPDAIRRMARELAAAEAAAVYGRIGTTTQEFGTLASWLVDVLNVLTGNLDRPGGAMFPLAAAGQRNASGAPGRGRALQLGRWRSRVRGLPESLGRAARRRARRGDRDAGRGPGPRADHARRQPGALDAELGADGARARGARLLRRARHLRQRDDAPRRRDPARRRRRCSAAHYDLALYQLAVRNVANYSPPVLPLDPTGSRTSGRRSCASPASRPGRACWPTSRRSTTSSPGEARAAARASTCEATAGRGRPAHRPRAAARHPAALRALRPDARRPRGGAARDRPRAARAAAAGRAAHAVGADRARAGARSWPTCRGCARRSAASATRTALVLIGRRQLRSNNSWMHNLPRLASGPERCTLHVHPDDAARLGLADGELAEVRSRTGTVQAPVEVTDGVMAGVVSLPHGWGHDAPGDAAGRRRGAAGRERERARRRGAGRRAVGQRRAQRDPGRGRARPRARAGVSDDPPDFAALGLLDGLEGEARTARDGLLRALHEDGASERGAARGGARGAARAAAGRAGARRERRPDRAPGGGGGRASTWRRSRRCAARPGSRSRRPTSPCSATST